MKYFDHLDHSGGFSYERWGDGTSISFQSILVVADRSYRTDVAPVHSIAAALFLKPQEIHHFDDIGYYHAPFSNCPADASDRCACNPNDGNNFGAFLSIISPFRSFRADPDSLTSQLLIGNIGTRVQILGSRRQSSITRENSVRHLRNIAIDNNPHVFVGSIRWRSLMQSSHHRHYEGDGVLQANLGLSRRPREARKVQRKSEIDSET